MQVYQLKVTPVKKMKLFIFLFGISIQLCSSAQSTLGGMHGHLIVPDAYNFTKNNFYFSTTYYPKDYRYLYEKLRGYANNPELYYSFGLNYISWMDVSFCVSRILKLDDPYDNGIGDRSINFKFKLLEETSKRPQIALMLEFPGINNWVASNAMVATKTIKKTSISIGYGSPYVLKRRTYGLPSEPDYYGSIFQWSLKPKLNSYLNGLLFSFTQKIGNESLNLAPTIEYDGDKLNAGLSFNHKKLNMSIYSPGIKSLAASAGINIEIK